MNRTTKRLKDVEMCQEGDLERQIKLGYVLTNLSRCSFVMQKRFDYFGLPSDYILDLSKAHVSYCHHLASVVCPMSVVDISLLRLAGC